MPLYEYKCEGCGETFEVIQKFADEPVTIHEKCGGPVRRLLSAPAFQFKGSGWYVTDYAKGNTTGPPAKHDSGSAESGKNNSSDKSSSTDTATKTDTKTETKSESKSESKPASSDKS